ncbi:MAG: NAD-dependent epimerase, partial [Bacteroidetes bacterium]|nr:NAD-dependent epimerase [Bacteroidota bacterium]
NISIRSSYNLNALTFSAAELYEKIKQKMPEFTIEYNPDFRQAIADSWPASIDDTQAQKDWGWKPEYDLDKMVDVMLSEIKKKLA